MTGRGPLGQGSGGVRVDWRGGFGDSGRKNPRATSGGRQAPAWTRERRSCRGACHREAHPLAENHPEHACTVCAERHADPEFTRWQRSTEWGREPYRPAAARSIATRANALLGNCRIVFGWPTWDPASGSDSAAAGWLSASALRSSGTMIPVGNSVQTAGHQDNTCARSA